ncbi:hypothetical protein JCM16303_004718 [Sporobolomyces ruberrimus]
MLLILLTLLTSLLPTLVLSNPVPVSVSPITPAPPQFRFLFTVNLQTRPLMGPLVVGPAGIRLDLPITGGTFMGRGGLSGTIRGDGADRPTIDPQTGIGSADARWIISLPPTPSTNGSDSLIFVSTSGPTQKQGGLNRAHLRIILETGVPEYYFFNSVLAVGVLEILNPNLIRIDVFNFADDWQPTDKPFVCLITDGEGCPNQPLGSH